MPCSSCGKNPGRRDPPPSRVRPTVVRRRATSPDEEAAILAEYPPAANVQRVVHGNVVILVITQ